MGGRLRHGASCISSSPFRSDCHCHVPSGAQGDMGTEKGKGQSARKQVCVCLRELQAMSLKTLVLLVLLIVIRNV